MHVYLFVAWSCMAHNRSFVTTRDFAWTSNYLSQSGLLRIRFLTRFGFIVNKSEICLSSISFVWHVVCHHYQLYFYYRWCYLHCYCYIRFLSVNHLTGTPRDPRGLRAIISSRSSPMSLLLVLPDVRWTLVHFDLNSVFIISHPWLYDLYRVRWFIWKIEIYIKEIWFIHILTLVKENVF